MKKVEETEKRQENEGRIHECEIASDELWSSQTEMKQKDLKTQQQQHTTTTMTATEMTDISEILFAFHYVLFSASRENAKDVLRKKKNEAKKQQA